MAKGQVVETKGATNKLPVVEECRDKCGSCHRSTHTHKVPMNNTKNGYWIKCYNCGCETFKNLR